MIPRLIENDIKLFLDTFPVVGIVGPRQVGKTTLAKKISNLRSTKSIYLDLELDSDIAKLDNAETFLTEYQDCCVVIDEIQRMPRLFPLIRALVDQKRIPGRFLLLGSASPHLIKNASESLAGRVTYKELHPLNLTEIAKDNTTYKEHWLRGGFPDAFLANDMRIVSEWLASFIDNYIFRDLHELGMPASATVTKRLLSMLSHLHGNILNKEQLSKSLGIDSRTVSKYLDFLEESFLIFRLQPYFSNTKKRLIKSPKIYFRDSGILHHHLGIKSYDNLIGHPQVGASFEGYFIEQVRQLLPREFDVCFYHTHDGAEIDLLLLKNNKPLSAIEIKFNNQPKISKGCREAMTSLNLEESYVVTPNSEKYKLASDITVCCISEFLSNILPKIIA